MFNDFEFSYFRLKDIYPNSNRKVQTNIYDIIFMIYNTFYFCANFAYWKKQKCLFHFYVCSIHDDKLIERNKKPALCNLQWVFDYCFNPTAFLVRHVFCFLVSRSSFHSEYQLRLEIFIFNELFFIRIAAFNDLWKVLSLWVMCIDSKVGKKIHS